MRYAALLFVGLFLLAACSSVPEDAGDIEGGVQGNPEPCICAAVYDPVCGSDGLTYSNECRAACAGVSLITPGECAEN